MEMNYVMISVYVYCQLNTLLTQAFLAWLRGTNRVMEE